MDAREKRYKKIAKSKAKEYLRKKKGYKTRCEKKAFKIAEKFRIKEWKNSLSAMDKAEADARLKAFRIYKSRINLIRNLIFTGILLLIVLILLVVLL